MGNESETQLTACCSEAACFSNLYWPDTLILYLHVPT